MVAKDRRHPVYEVPKLAPVCSVGKVDVGRPTPATLATVEGHDTRRRIERLNEGRYPLIHQGVDLDADLPVRALQGATPALSRRSISRLP